MDFDTLFPDIRDSGETQLRQCQLVIIRMFKIFDHLCRKYKIEYFLTGGSLLGAIRHQGFVPWDDDLDVGMTRENYEKFVQYAVPELPNDIFFQTPQTDIYFPSCDRVEARLRDRYSSYVWNKKFHNGLMMDIGVYDKAYFPHNALICVLNRFLKALFWQVGENNNGNQRRTRVIKWIARYVPLPLVYSTCFVSSRKMIKMPGEYFRKNEIKKFVAARFEGIDTFVPQEWDTCLRRQFGDDYMQLPPVEKRKFKHSKGTPNPFHPCQHYASLQWEDRKKLVNLQSEDGSKRIKAS